MSMHCLDSDRKDSNVLSHQSPTVILPDAPLPMHLEEVHSSPVMEKVPFERHSVILEEDNPSSYNIEEIFGSFTFNLCRKEFSQKRVRKVKQSDGTFEEMQEDEVLFEKTDEDLMTVATTSTYLMQGIVQNITILNDKLLETK